MPVNQAYESDKSVNRAGTGRDKRALSNVSVEKSTNGALNVELDTYFADERIHIPERVSVHLHINH